MAPTLPSSLSPHICVFQSSDLQDLLAEASLPPLSQLFQSFCPLPQVTTRTTTLNPVPHATFALRFSELPEVEAALHEDEEQRAGRTLDWIGSRVAARSARWVDIVERRAGRDDKTPWWEEVKRCIEGDNVPNRYEGWSHPVAVVYAVSTLAANPLQALQDMYARPLDFPPWVDKTYLRYLLIVHPSNSPLSDPIADSLYNAVKKQYGLHSYILRVDFPENPPPQAVSVPLPVPRLPPLSTMESSPMPQSQTPSHLSVPRSSFPPPPRSPDPMAALGTRIGSGPGALLLSQPDIKAVGDFMRDFVVMSMIPWMEKCVMEWNDAYSSSRRLPSRLFSSTRRLFGSSVVAVSAPVTPTHGSNPSISSVTSRFTSHAPSSSVTSLASVTSFSGATEGAVTQQRRLAEFATVLGDYKLAVTVWETLRKESKGGSDILPLLVAPSPALALHTSNAIMSLQSIASERPAYAQLRALAFAAEEPPTALLLAHAAFLTSRKNAVRRASLWYLFAADRLEKAGIKSLALYFFRQAHQLYKQPIDKELSPSFWESENRSPLHWKGFDAVQPGIEHELGRLLYTTGDTEGAVQYFVGLLQEPITRTHPSSGGLGLVNDDSDDRLASSERVYLEDFRVALKHFKFTEPDKFESASLHLPVKFCQPKETRLRLPGNAMDGNPENWKRLEEDWTSFWRPRGQEHLQSGGKAAVGDTFWIDLVMRNPLNVEVTISGLTAVVKDAKAPESPSPGFVEVEVIDDLTLGARETRTIPIAVNCTEPSSLIVSDIKFDFLSLLTVTESLSVRGRRLHDTPHQRQNKVYAPDIVLNVEVEDSGYRLHSGFIDDRHLSLFQGEWRRVDIRLHNSGSRAISELWLVTEPYSEVWVDTGAEESPQTPDEVETLLSENSLAVPLPCKIDLEQIHTTSTLQLDELVKLPILMHASRLGEHDLCLLLVFREAGDDAFHSTRLTRQFDVHSVLDISTASKVGPSPDLPYSVDLDISNITHYSVKLTQVTSISHTWACALMSDFDRQVLFNTACCKSDICFSGSILPQQHAQVTLSAWRDTRDSNVEEIRQFVAKQLRSVIQGENVPQESPPAIQLYCRHLTKSDSTRRISRPSLRHFFEHGRRNTTSAALAASYRHIPYKLRQHIFPIFNPASVDFIVFWEIPSQGRHGHCLLTGLTLGATHAPLRELIEEAESAKTKRSMYAETQRERVQLLETIRYSEWNAEMDPLVIASIDGQVVRHDFSQGPCQVPVTFALRNLSLTNPVRYTLKLGAVPLPISPHPNLLSPQYSGRLTHRGELAALTTATVHAKLTVERPGCYALTPWSAQSEARAITHASVTVIDA
ncbi:hypothetical protein PHLGIDRAFT_27246 [Phlebiopsis gigantea 11061_1 CR5-6]|uniref:Uncharacterized protein n=1 Tax=Phlebiopsis gigantea (strain 11061_1 CR5-6) TaxID=745531 RepID=A0A0C3PWM1_PHLG1|nr:hypothetical protein PHLGIDRAFT_27246 [Phlebiopsis gigantea 11061_1 CR5-6]